MSNHTSTEKELIAYKMYNNFVNERILGTFPDSVTHFDVTGNMGVNNKGIGIPIQRTQIFVVTKDNIDKWREMLDFGFKITNDLFINDFVYPEFTSIHYSRLQDILTTFINCTHASKLDYESAFKQIRIHHLQLPFFSFNFDCKTYISTVLEFRTSDAPREFNKCVKSIVFIAIYTHHELFTKKVNPFEGTVSNFPQIIKQPDCLLDSSVINLTRYINSDITHLTDVMVNDEWLGAFSKAMNIQQHEALIFLAKYYNVKTKKAKKEISVETLSICGTFMLKTQCLTYDSEKLET